MMRMRRMTVMIYRPTPDSHKGSRTCGVSEDICSGPIKASGSATQRPQETMSGHLPHALINMHGPRVWGKLTSAATMEALG
ncbi:unnamed protein product [Boreogadus saida]